MKQLYESGKVKRFALTNHKPGYEFVYTLSLEHKRQAEHSLMVVDAYIDLLQLPGEVVFVLQRKLQYAINGRRREFIPDALVIYNSKTHDMIFFLEIEREVKRNYSKVKQYEEYRNSMAYSSEPWAAGGKIFPAVVVVGERKDLLRIRINPGGKVKWFLQPTGASWEWLAK